MEKNTVPIVDGAPNYTVWRDEFTYKFVGECNHCGGRTEPKNLAHVAGDDCKIHLVREHGIVDGSETA